MNRRNPILTMGTACSKCSSKGHGCEKCYTTGLEGVKGVCVSCHEHGRYWAVSASFLSNEGFPVIIFWNPKLEEWCFGVRVPEDCKYTTPRDARADRIRLLVDIGLLEKVKPYTHSRPLAVPSNSEYQPGTRAVY